MKMIGHYGPRLVAGAMLVTATLTIAGYDIGLAAAVIIAGSIILASISQIVHDGRLCARCMATMPLDGEARAARRRPILRFVHVVTTPLRYPRIAGRPFIGPVVPYILIALAVNAAVANIGGFAGTYAARLVHTAVFTLPLAAIYASAALHARLQPWCPYCRWGRGDDGPHEHAPDPDPHGRHPRPLPA